MCCLIGIEKEVEVCLIGIEKEVEVCLVGIEKEEVCLVRLLCTPRRII